MKVIFTADDFGAVPAIDRAVINAAKAGKLNSVAAFSNARRSIMNVKQLVKETANTEIPVEIGCHLTLTSGRPIDPLAGLNHMLRTKKDTRFREFSKFKCPKKNKVTASKKAVKDQIKKQIHKLEKEAGIVVAHLSSHHNSHYWFDPYLEALCEVSEETGIPMRNPLTVPEWKNTWFYEHLANKLRWNGNSQFETDIGTRIVDYEEEIEEIVSNFDLKMPSLFDASHYGPPARIGSSPKKIEKWTDKKLKGLNESVSRIGEGDVVEYVVHIILDDYNRLDEFKGQSTRGAFAYSGIERKYYDRRMAEMRSIMNFKLPSNVTFGSWKDLK